MATNECNYVPNQLPNRWKFSHFESCPEFNGTPSVPFASVYNAVIIEAFLWGLGTAIGELPPYFVSRAASLAGKKQEEIAEIETETQFSPK
jgi:hypothetical protein